MNPFDQYRVVQSFKTSELLLQAPRDRVWPFLLDFKSFNDTFDRIEVLDGTPNTVGAVSRLVKRQGQWYMPPYLVKIIHLDSGRQVVWKMYPEEGDAFNNFVDFSLVEQGPRATLFVIRLYKEHRVGVSSPEALAAAAKQIHEASERLERDMMFPNLKRLTEGAER